MELILAYLVSAKGATAAVLRLDITLVSKIIAGLELSQVLQRDVALLEY